MTNQEALSKSYIGLMNQGCRSLKAGEGYLGCAYRGKDRTACGVGKIVPDNLHPEEWDKSENSTRIDSIIKKFESAQKFFSKVDLNLLAAMQNIHDGARIVDNAFKSVELSADKFREQVTNEYKALANRFGLRLPEWEQLT